MSGAEQTSLLRAQHRRFVNHVSTDISSFEFVVSEHLRMSGVYWGACALSLLDALSDLDREQIVGFVSSCAHACGGYGGNVEHDPHMLYTLSAVQILVLFDALEQLDEEKTVSYVAALQNADGSFRGDEWGEVDTRFTYCALCCLSLLDRLDAVNVDAALAHIRECENFDGGFGCEPGGESHSGQVFTCVGALAIGGALESSCRQDTLAWWLCERQTPGGGLNGRPQKDADVCYSWWVLSSLCLLERVEWVNGAALRNFILRCQDPEGGGISDKPGDEPDIFHTFFGIAGLSLLGTDGVEPIDAAHAMPLKVMQRLRKKQQDERKA